MQKMKKYIEYITVQMDAKNTDNIGIHVGGKLDPKIIKAIEKYFTVERDFFGYYKFERINKKFN